MHSGLIYTLSNCVDLHFHLKPKLDVFCFCGGVFFIIFFIFRKQMHVFKLQL